eukprot:6466003-Amphidinium_carterae.1
MGCCRRSMRRVLAWKPFHLDLSSNPSVGLHLEPASGGDCGKVAATLGLKETPKDYADYITMCKAMCILMILDFSQSCIVRARFKTVGKVDSQPSGCASKVINTPAGDQQVMAETKTLIMHVSLGQQARLLPALSTFQMHSGVDGFARLDQTSCNEFPVVP